VRPNSFENPIQKLLQDMVQQQLNTSAKRNWLAESGDRPADIPPLQKSPTNGRHLLDPFKTTHSAQPFTSTVIDYYTRSGAPLRTRLRRTPHIEIVYYRMPSLKEFGAVSRTKIHIYSLSAAVAARLRFVNGNRSLDRFGTMTSLESYTATSGVFQLCGRRGRH
jgi:hypothetical protein